MADGRADLGVYGMGTMGANLALNFADNGGFTVALGNRTAGKTAKVAEENAEFSDRLVPASSLEDFIAALKTPRVVIVMVKAGAPVDEQMDNILPHLDDGDILIDAGNADFNDTVRRASKVDGTGVNFVGMGVSGGEEGARHGPSIMVGGDKEVWASRLKPLLEPIAARYDGSPCVAWLGPDGAGHFVKTIHNGIEYADMQMIAEVYGVMRDGLAMGAPAVAEVFGRWNKGTLASYLVEIASDVAGVTDEATGAPILDVILDRAGQKGTGRWTAIAAQNLGAPVPVIEAALMARNTSARVAERAAGEDVFGPAPTRLDEGAITIDMLEQAMIAGKILCYAQGFGLMTTAAKEYGWALPLPDIAKVWRAGCIIRSAMLDDMATALGEHPEENLMLAPFFANLLKKNQTPLRQVVAQSSLSGLPVPALAGGLTWFDIMRTGRSTANMIQALRDFFGAHGFVRMDNRTSGQHGPWKMKVG